MNLFWNAALFFIKSNAKQLLLAGLALALVTVASTMLRDYYINKDQKIDDGKTVVIKKIEGELKGLQNVVDRVETHRTIDDKETVVNIEVKEVIKKEAVTSKENLNKKVEEINDKYSLIMKNSKPDNLLTVNKQRDDEISNARITSLWGFYCQDEPNNTKCKEV